VLPAVVVIPPKVVLQGTGPYDIVTPLGEANAAGGIFPAMGLNWTEALTSV